MQDNSEALTDAWWPDGPCACRLRHHVHLLSHVCPHGNFCVQIETMQSYGIAPTAMTADHGYIAAGAQRGMVRLMERLLLASLSTKILCDLRSIVEV